MAGKASVPQKPTSTGKCGPIQTPFTQRIMSSGKGGRKR